MQKVLETLIHLQDIDKELQQLEAERGDLPQKVRELDEQVANARNILDSKIENRAALVSEKASLDNEAALLGQQLKKYKVQLYQVKTNKEYDAITVEIETSEQSKDEKEFRALELEENTKQLAEEIESAQKELEDLEKILDENKKELEKKLEKTKEQQDDLDGKRAEFAGKLTRPILSSYDRIRLARSGAAVARLVGGACSECSSRIPPQRALEIRMMNKLNYCEVCGRIVVWTGEPEEVD